MNLKIKDIELVFTFKKLENLSMNNEFFHYIKIDDKYLGKFTKDKTNSIKSNKNLNDNTILNKLLNSSFNFKIEQINFFKINNEVKNLKIELKEI